MKPRFSIRDLGWLILVVAILLMWYLDHSHQVKRNRFTVETVRASDGEPILLRDNEADDVVLIRDKTEWKVAVPTGKPMPVFNPD